MAVTWSVELTSDGSLIDEPYAVLGSTLYQFTITNTSIDKKATSVGFYIKEAVTEGEKDFPSSLGKTIDWYDILGWGQADPTEGAFIVQGVATTQCTYNMGTAATPVALSVGTGDDSNQVEPGASVTISIQVVVPAAVVARRLFFELELDYQQEDS